MCTGIAVIRIGAGLEQKLGLFQIEGFPDDPQQRRNAIRADRVDIRTCRERLRRFRKMIMFQGFEQVSYARVGKGLARRHASATSENGAGHKSDHDDHTV